VNIFRDFHALGYLNYDKNSPNMMSEAISVEIRDEMSASQEELRNLMARAFLLTEGDIKTAFAKAMLLLMN